ncbi:MAG: response regulator [Desulfamplus sp.]|nr:response regulator [Desulfamplus sp.]
MDTSNINMSHADSLNTYISNTETSNSNMNMSKPNVIVLVDDVPANLRLLTGILSFDNYIIRPIIDPIKALSLISAEPPDIILLDIQMPKISGYDVCKSLKSNPNTKDIPVIFITANNDVQDKVKGFSLGAVDYITKPFEADEVIARVQTHLKLYNLQKALHKKTEETQDLNRRLKEENKERRKIEIALRESSLWLNSMFDTLEEAVIIQNPDKIIMNINPAAERMFGYTKDEIKKRSTEIFHVDNKHYLTFQKIVTDAFLSGEPVSFEYKMLRKNGEIFPSEHSVSLLKNTDAKFIGILCVIRDMTAKKEAEKKLRESEQLNTVFEIAGTICHELNQPLMTISGYSELVMMDIDPKTSAYIKLGKIQEQVERMAEITKRLMNISRYKTKKYLDGNIIDLVKASEN